MRGFFVLILLCAMVLPVHAVDYEPPPVPKAVEHLLPDSSTGFGEGILYIIKTALKELRPELGECIAICASVIAIAMLISIMGAFPGKSLQTVNLAGIVGVCVLLLGSTNSLLQGASHTVQQISSYGQLLLPVMTASAASQGGITSSAALYTGTAFFDTLLSMAISGLLLPMMYVYLAVMIADSAIGEDTLSRIRDFIKWAVTWSLKTILYVFTGYITLTGVISGATDKTMLKATKLTISGMVPVIGGILSDASETILVGAGVVKNAVGMYGLIAVMAIVILPFLRIGIMYLLLKISCALCGLFPGTQLPKLLQGFSDAMGLLLGMTGAVALLFMISIVCFLKGVST